MMIRTTPNDIRIKGVVAYLHAYQTCNGAVPVVTPYTDDHLRRVLRMLKEIRADTARDVHDLVFPSWGVRGFGYTSLQLDDVARMMLRALERLVERLPVLASSPRHAGAIHAVDSVLTPITTTKASVLEDYVNESGQDVYDQFLSLPGRKNEADLARAMHESMLFYDEASELEQALQASMAESEFQQALELSRAMMED
jgi:hypothetical protein